MARRLSVDEENIQYIINEAAKLGVQNIYENQPVFKDSQELLLKHIDLKKLRIKAEELYSSLEQNKISGERAVKYLQKELADYVTSAEFFDKEGNEIFVKRSIEAEPNLLEKFVSFFKPKSPGEKELNNNIKAIHDLYTFYKSGGYEESMPELSKSFEKANKYVHEIKRSNFASAAANIFEAYGQISEKEANSWRREARKNMRELVK